MQITFSVEYELTKEVVYDDDIEAIAEYTFVVSAEWLSKLYNEHLIKIFHYEDHTLDEFLDLYEPEVEGVSIYYLAKGQNEIIEEGWSEIAKY